MFIFIIISLIAAALAGLYAFNIFKSLFNFYGLDCRKSWVKNLNIILAVITAFLCGRVFWTSAMIILHILAAWAVLDITAFIVRKSLNKQFKSGCIYEYAKKLYQCGLLPLAITASLFSYGFYNIHRIQKTSYTVNTSKNVRPYRIAFLSDIHYDTIQPKEVLFKKIADINADNPDIVILGGDITDESTSKESMEEIFEVLGKLKNKYGIYYVYGNHDRQPYSKHKAFTEKELEAAILKNGITILQNQTAEINDDLIIAGREDAWLSKYSNKSRAPMAELLKDADKRKFIITADHQPADSKENSAEGADLQISGHTHAGQLWPLGRILRLLGQLNYGEFKEGDCTILVSSGVVGWGYPIRTERHCEYLIIDIVPQKQ